MTPRKPSKTIAPAVPLQGSFDAFGFDDTKENRPATKTAQPQTIAPEETKKKDAPPPGETSVSLIPGKKQNPGGAFEEEEDFDDSPYVALGISPQKPLSISQITGHIKRILECDAILSDVWVEGEISNLIRAASGHAYFTLKDQGATLKAVLWAGSAKRVKTAFANGSKVVAHGNLSLYEPRGEYQLVVNDLRLAGLGALFEAFEKLKLKLAGEGLFDSDRKISLPFLPHGIGIVTSPTGAVIKDMYRVIRRRFPNMPIYLVPVKVQGDGAAAEIAAGIRRLDADPRIDVIIIARGGGSLEDLWAFNEEVTARAIAAAVKPIVSGVGHETDTTIADFVADVRAATPSVAGELVVPVKENLVRDIFELRARLGRGLRNRLAIERQRLRRARSNRFLERPALYISDRRLFLANKISNLETAAREQFKRFRHQCDLLRARLTALNPRAVLQRGYLMAENQDGIVVSSISQISKGAEITLHLSDGRARTSVIDIEPKPERKTRTDSRTDISSQDPNSPKGGRSTT
ncbi:MAG: exodeoxyribonuclease VII large subunit [Candidatus Ozemobacteraceae bacterium]